MRGENRRTASQVKLGRCRISDGEALPAELVHGFAGRRLLEFAAGRTAARRALAQLDPAWAALPIGRAEDGAPLPPPGVALSISHGQGLAIAAAAAGDGRLGIDLCDLAHVPRVRRVAPRWIPDEDRALVREGAPDEDADWAKLWALKEAAAKALRHALLDGGLRASRLACLDPPRFAAPAGLYAEVWIEDDAAVALVVDDR